MRRARYLMAAVLVATTALATVQAQNASDRDAIMKVNAQIEDASARRDAAAYAQLTTRDFIRVANRIFSKDEWIKQSVAVGDPRKTSLNDEPLLHVHDSVAVLVTKNTGQGPGRGGQAQGPQRMSRVYVKSNGQWLLAATISSTIRTSAASATAARSQSPSPVTEPAGSVEREIFQTLRAVNDANRNADAAAFSRVTADSFVGVGATGNVVTKADRMKAIAAATPGSGTFNPTRLTIKVYGNGAVAVWENADGGFTLKGLAKQQGRWVQVLNHNAPAPAPAS